MYKVPIEKIHFRKILKSKYLNEKNGGYRWRRRVNQDNFPSYRTGAYDKEKVELLFKLGYKMDKDDLIFSILNKIKIPNLDRFGIQVDEEIVNLCHQYKFYPDINLDLIKDKHLSELQRLCRSSSLNKVKEYIDLNDLKPDQKCLENACKTGNYALINYLIALGCNMDVEYLKDLKIDGRYERKLRWAKYRRRRASRYRRRPIKSSMEITENYNGINLHSKENIINNLIYNQKVQQKSLENKINYLENLLKEFYDEGIDIYEHFEDNLADIKENYFDNSIKLDTCESFDIDNQIKTDEIKNIDISIDIIKEKEDKDFGQLFKIENGFLIINEKCLSKIKKLPKMRYQKAKTTDKIKSFFDYDSKQLKSFNQVKESLQNYFLMNDSYTKDDIIFLDDEIKKNVGLEDSLNKDVYINKKDLDKLTCLFYD